MCAAVGLELDAVSDVPQEALSKAAALDAARAAKRLCHRRRVRAELQAEGWTVETTKTGTTLRTS